MRRRPAAVTVVASTLLVAGCSGAAGGPSQGTPTSESPSVTSRSPVSSTTPAGTATALDLLPGMPAPLDPKDVWAADRPGAMSPVVAGDRDLIYVPNSKSNTVTEIDPHTYRVVRTLRVGREPQHVVPSWDLKTLWVNNDLGNSLTALNPRTGKRGRTVPVTDPYNLYFTPDGKYAVVMASAAHTLDFRDPHTMKLRHRTHVPCAGVNHADFSLDGRYFVVSCEFSSELLKVDTQTFTVTKVRRLMARPGHAMPMPQDVKMSPDGRTFYIADMKSDGIWFVDGETLRVRRFLHTGKGAHGLYVTRDSKHLLITNREEGSISVLDFATNGLVGRWRIPGGGSPDMGGLSSNGKVFWVSGRYNSEVYAISTVDGHLIRRIRVGVGPHGLCVFPQPGRYSLGHTGVFR